MRSVSRLALVSMLFFATWAVASSEGESVNDLLFQKADRTVVAELRIGVVPLLTFSRSETASNSQYHVISTGWMNILYRFESLLSISKPESKMTSELVTHESLQKSRYDFTMEDSKIHIRSQSSRVDGRATLKEMLVEEAAILYQPQNLVKLVQTIGNCESFTSQRIGWMNLAGELKEVDVSAKFENGCDGSLHFTQNGRSVEVQVKKLEGDEPTWSISPLSWPFTVVLVMK